MLSHAKYQNVYVNTFKNGITNTHKMVYQYSIESLAVGVLSPSLSSSTEISNLLLRTDAEHDVHFANKTSIGFSKAPEGKIDLAFQTN